MSMLNDRDYAILEFLDVMLSGELRRILNRYGAARLTGCPKCLVDDFIHIEGCPLSTGAVPEAVEFLHEALSTQVKNPLIRYILCRLLPKHWR